MEFLIFGIISIFVSAITSTLVQNKKAKTRFITFEQGQQLANRIKSTEEVQRKEKEANRKLNNKILAQTQEFNNYDYKRAYKLKEIEQKIDIVNMKLEEKGKHKLTEEEAKKTVKGISEDLKEIDDIEKEFSKVIKKNQNRIKI